MKLKPGSLEAKEMIMRMTSDERYAPDWKTEAGLAETYFDSLQLPPNVRKFMEERGQPVIVNNLIQPIINGVIGMESKTRTDYQVRADDDAGIEMAEALNEKMNEQVRLARVHRANSDAFKRQTIAGLGWVEARRNPDPFGSDYLVEEVDWREVDYDWRATRPDLQDARWLRRRRWLDQDVAEAMFPRHRDLIKRVVNHQGLFDFDDQHQVITTMPDFVGPYTTELQSAYDLYGGAYVNDERKQVMFSHVQYKRPTRGYVIKAGDVKAAYNPHNRVQRAMIDTGRAKVFPATYFTTRHAWFMGPHLIDDAPCPYAHNRYNLIPMFCFREGGTRKPYGLVRNMMSAQDEVNFRRSMLTWLLKARLVIKDQDATIENDQAVHSKVAAMDGVINLNPSRKGRQATDGGFKVVSDVAVAGQHFDVMQDAMKQLQDLVGVYSSFLGQESNAQSGVAINSLVEQATVTLSDVFDNYQHGRQQVGELLLSMIEQDIGDEPQQIKVFVNEARPTKTVTLNERVQDEEGRVTISNRLTNLRKHVVLADVQSAPGYRAQQLTQMMELAQTLPDPAKLALLEDIILLTELPRKQELVNKVKQAIGMGVNVEDLSDQERQAYEQQQQQAQQELQMAMREREAEVSVKEATAAEKQANTALKQRETVAITSEEKLENARAEEILSRISLQNAEQQSQDHVRAQKLNEHVDNLLAQIG